MFRSFERSAGVSAQAGKSYAVPEMAYGIPNGWCEGTPLAPAHLVVDRPIVGDTQAAKEGLTKANALSVW
jgi:hypothetical protein